MNFVDGAGVGSASVNVILVNIDVSMTNANSLLLLPSFPAPCRLWVASIELSRAPSTSIDAWRGNDVSAPRTVRPPASAIAERRPAVHMSSTIFSKPSDTNACVEFYCSIAHYPIPMSLFSPPSPSSGGFHSSFRRRTHTHTHRPNDREKVSFHALNLVEPKIIFVVRCAVIFLSFCSAAH